MAVHSVGSPASVHDARLHVSSLHFRSYQNTTATGFSYVAVLLVHFSLTCCEH